jgi:preprotein translocase SecF subunit
MLRPLVQYLPADPRVPVMRWRYVGFAVTGVSIALTILLYLIVGLNYGIDFRGGTMIEVQSTTGRADIAGVRRQLEALGVGDVQVQEFGSPADLMIRIGAAGEGAAAEVERVRQTLGAAYQVRRVEQVGPAVSSELAMQSILALSLGAVAIFLYLWFRFEWQFALGAIVTTVHDIIMCIGVYVVLRLDFDLNAIAAILTIMGYSLNDTVVIYDRIREMLRKYKQMPVEELLNRAINSTFSRTIITSMTTFFAALALVLFGGEVLRGFSIAMLVGVVVGTYSTIFVASPLLLYLNIRNTRAPTAAGTPAKARP